MRASRSCTTALALAFVAGCVRPQAPVASAASTAATASTSTSASTPKGAAEGSSVASVRPGNQRPLNGAAVAFASYLNRMHNRIHPEFTDKVLAKLDTLPPNHPMNDNKLITRLRKRAVKDNRLDDASEDVIRKRLQTYEDESRPLLEYYLPHGVVQTIDATQPPVVVLSDILHGIIKLSNLPTA